MEITFSGSGKQSGKVTVDDNTFAQAFNEGLVHQVITAYMAAGRQGSKAQKTRSEVRGGGKKPWRQKGTGRARAGTIRSPLWRGGGVTFAAKPRSFKQKVNKKMYRAALRSIFSELVRQNRLHVVKDLHFAEPKTKLMVERLKELELKDVLCVVDTLDNNLMLSARNLPNVEVCQVKNLGPVSLVQYDNVLITEAAIKQVEEWLK